MTTLTDEQLLHLNFRGLIPGPTETETQFMARSDYCLHLGNFLTEKQDLPFDASDVAGIDVLREAFPMTQELYGMEPDWLPIFFSNYKLVPWHGGCAWIFQMTENSPTAAFFQLRKAFREQGNYLGLYQRKELMAHEISHVGRMMFQEPCFEEILAYRSSQSWFRRTFGPLLEAPWEGMAFVFILLLIFILDLSLLSVDLPAYYSLFQWLKLIPIALLGIALCRLWRRQHCFSKCLDKLTQLTHSCNKANALIYRLTDSEISQIARMPLEEIDNFLGEQKTNSLKGRLLYLLYKEN